MVELVEWFSPTEKVLFCVLAALITAVHVFVLDVPPVASLIESALARCAGKEGAPSPHALPT